MKDDAYKGSLPYLIEAAKERVELFKDTETQLKFVSLLEGVTSDEELADLLSMDQVLEFTKATIILTD